MADGNNIIIIGRGDATRALSWSVVGQIARVDLRSQWKGLVAMT